MQALWRTSLLALALAAPTARATDLLQAWQAAQQNDRELAVARAAQATAQPLREQARSLWRPGVALTASAGVATGESDMRGAQFSAPGMGTSNGVNFSTSVTGGTATRWALQARQPLLNAERRAQQQQLGLQADSTELQWQAAQQALMLRTAQRYFELAVAQESLQVLQRQYEAVQQAAAEAQDRFALGAAPITATHEARARQGALRAQVLAA
ncbi:MAG TPA: TolC family protein, partial [Giesbergeria sp.]|nr:TolC family protein [Giesbergeria sp.]